MKHICESCKQVFTPLNDDISDKKYCPKCQDPKKRAFRKEFFKKIEPKDKDEKLTFRDPTIFEKQMLPYGLMTRQAFLEDEKFNPMLLAVQILRTDKFKTDLKTELFYVYNSENGIWNTEAKVFIHSAVTQCLGTNYKPHQKNDITDYIKGNSYCRVIFNNKLIALKNGYLDPTTQKITPFNPEENVFYSLPVKYDPEAKCPNWEVFIKDILEEDDAKLLQEWSGYLLLPDYRYHKMMWIVGTGRNGKGVWARTMEYILGSHVSHVGLEEMDGLHRFSMSHLYGSLFNLCSEPTTTKVLRTQILKSATGQDTIDAEIKGHNERLRLVNCGKFTILGNNFPRVRDRSLAFRERTGFIEFKKEFIGENQIENLEQNWLTNDDEVSGILNWMLKGLKRLLENRKFSVSKSQNEIMVRFLRHSDTIQSFLNEACKIGTNADFTLRDDAYNAYKDYCDLYGLEQEVTKRFTQQLRETRRIYDHRRLIAGKNQRVWTGLILLDQETAETTGEPKIDQF